MISRLAVIALFAASAVGGVALGATLKINQKSTYHLLAVSADGEADIIDHGLTATDCADALALAHAVQPETRFECEAE